MAGQPVVVSQSFLDSMSHSLAQLQNRQYQLELAVQQVRTEQEQSRSLMNDLHQRFTAFMEEDRLAKNVQLAQSRLNTIRQELRTDFGHYAQVRRHATGILQGMDVGLIPHDTIRQATEELMLATPRYWLTPALVSLAAWIRDDRSLAERALKEAQRRDNDKSSLFFALVLRRAQRNQAAVRWLRLYLARQDAGRLGQEFSVLLDAVAIGGFGHAAKELILKHADEWYRRLVTEPTTVDAQVARWRDWADSYRRQVPSGIEVLPAVSPTWPQLRAAYEQASVFEPAEAALRAVYERPQEETRSLIDRMDDLLARLVSSFDAEEAPLRKREAEMLAVIDSGGDKVAARKHDESMEAVFDRQIDFLDLLTNAAVARKGTRVSAATQRLAVALCRDWIDQAAGQLEAKGIAAAPARVDLEIGTWKYTITEGTAEKVVVANLNDHLDSRERYELNAVGSDLPTRVGRIAAAVCAAGALAAGIAGLIPITVLLLLAGGGAIAWAEYDRIDKRRRREVVRARIQRDKAEQTQRLRTALAELVDLIRLTDAARAGATDLHAFLQGLRPETHLERPPDTARGVIT
ncbi:hypothetical protein [Glycomyces tritici]|uniref:Uncharacterized protein n=1 Tax=Glycomyces tritici TaxID=2665176 RepID=A0ABT7YVN4_9ACTN|nr:hypothetical protein [Glycomyces tritici]MDN3242434.1 hypothetical protein [Glycomyces tritici]